MKKHIIGLALFSLITGVSAFIFVAFSSFDISKVFAPKTKNQTTEQVADKGIESPIVTQAVFDVKTGNLIWEINPSKINDFPVLNIYIKDERGIRLLDSIHTLNYFTKGQVPKFSKQYFEMNKLFPKANLYLIPDTTLYSDKDENQLHTRFDIDKAIPVTIDYGK